MLFQSIASLLTIFTFRLQHTIAIPCTHINGTGCIVSNLEPPNDTKPPNLHVKNFTTSSHNVDTVTSEQLCEHVACPSGDSAGHDHCRSRGCDYCVVNLQGYTDFHCDGGRRGQNGGEEIGEGEMDLGDGATDGVTEVMRQF